MLGGIGAEVIRVADSVGDFRIVSEPESQSGTRLTAADMVAIQKLDLIEQTLRSLGNLLGHIAEAEGDTIDTPALLNALPLTDLADRLRSKPARTEPDGGTLELF